MFDIIFDFFMLVVLMYVLAVMFFAFDAIFLQGIFASRVRNWISKRFE